MRQDESAASRKNRPGGNWTVLVLAGLSPVSSVRFQKRLVLAPAVKLEAVGAAGEHTGASVHAFTKNNCVADADGGATATAPATKANAAKLRAKERGKDKSNSVARLGWCATMPRRSSYPKRTGAHRARV